MHSTIVTLRVGIVPDLFMTDYVIYVNSQVIFYQRYSVFSVSTFTRDKKRRFPGNQLNEVGTRIRLDKFVWTTKFSKKKSS